MTESGGARQFSADMAHSLPPGSKRKCPRASNSRVPSRSLDSSSCPVNVPLTHESYKKGMDQRKNGKGESRELRGIPAALSSRLLFSCTSCEAVFAAKSQLEKHLLWNHSDRGSYREKRPLYHVASSGGHKRVADSAPPPHRHPKQAKLGIPPENGEVSHNNILAKQKEACLFDEDPERMRHRRKQKTPKKFTGEQPSITGTFGLKGLGKAEDISRGRRTRIVQGRIEETRNRSGGTSASRKVHTAAPPGSVEDKCQHQISKRGEVICPNCSSVTRKTMAGLRKHMEVCEQLQEALRCQHCRKQFKSKAGLNYHTMAEHVNKEAPMDEQKERERLRKVLKQMGKLRCPKEDCSASFTSLMGYQYHTQRCGKHQCAGEKLQFNCPHCSKEYQSKAGRDYHVRSEHSTAPSEPQLEAQQVESEEFERTPSGRVRRHSAQVAVFHLQEIAEDELAKEGSRRRMKEDLVPDSKRLNYLRPGLPTFNPQLLEAWKTQVKENGFICCPNNCCEAIYSSVSGLKAHLANCNKGNHSVGKYHCLLCKKEFSSESGVKYHILKTHSQNWFRVAVVTSPNKKKSPPMPLRKEGETGSTGKKRGRKPKERPLITSMAATAPMVKDMLPILKTHPKNTEDRVEERTPSSESRGTARKSVLSRRGK